MTAWITSPRVSYYSLRITRQKYISGKPKLQLRKILLYSQKVSLRRSLEKKSQGPLGPARVQIPSIRRMPYLLKISAKLLIKILFGLLSGDVYDSWEGCSIVIHPHFAHKETKFRDRR